MPQRISDVLDILRLIFKLLDKRDLAHLLRVSRRFFACAVPLLWAEVLDPEHLLTLLPIDTREKITDKEWVNSLKPLDSDGLRRFQLYTPYITRLTLPIRRNTLDPTCNILTMLVSTRPFLPGLRELLLYLRCEYRLHEDEDLRPTVEALSIIEPFLSPTLVEIHTVNRQERGLYPLLTCELTEMIARNCPNIRVLDMYSNYGTMENRNSPVSLSGATTSSSLANLSNLQILGISPEVLFPDALSLLGSLPQLKSLSIYSLDEHPATIDLSDPMISSDSFPALRHLAVFCSGESVGLISQLWKIPPLVRRLVSVCVRFYPDSETEGDWHEIRDGILAICQGSPHITDLHIGMEDVYLSTEFLYSPLVLNQLKCLPLQRLRILDATAIPATPCDWNQLALSFPHLKYLHMDVPPLTVQDLTAIARHLPSLHFLGVQLDLGSWTSGVQLPPESSTRPSTTPIPSLRLIIVNFSVDDWPSLEDCAKMMSTTLYRLWPNGVYCECWASFTRRNVAGGPINMLINESIKQLCAPNEVNPLSDDEINEGWEHGNPRRVRWLRPLP